VPFFLRSCPTLSSGKRKRKEGEGEKEEEGGVESVSALSRKSLIYLITKGGKGGKGE